MTIYDFAKFKLKFLLNAQVECIDGGYGHYVYVLINPVFDQETHFVVEKVIDPNI